MTRPDHYVPFPTAIDSTTMAAFRSCPQKAFRQYLQHWKPKGESVHLTAGGAFAKGIETARVEFYVNGAAPLDAVARGVGALIKAYGTFECPPDSAKSLERMCGALEFYFDRYPLGVDTAIPITAPGGGRGIEFSFAEPIGLDHPETGEPLLYSGRADMIADFAGGVYIFDEKTTSSLGASWAKQWDMRSQFTAYTWAARSAGIDAKGVIVRGVSILKTKYDTAEAIASRSEWEIERWLRQTRRDLERLIEAWHDYNTSGDVNTFDFDLDHACSEYGGCSFLPVCKAREPEKWLPMYFQQRIWDPLAREELTAEQSASVIAAGRGNG